METKMNYEIVENAETFEKMLARVREAQKIYASYTQEQVDKIFRAAAMAAARPAGPPPMMTVCVKVHAPFASFRRAVPQIAHTTHKYILYQGQGDFATVKICRVLLHAPSSRGIHPRAPAHHLDCAKVILTQLPWRFL